MRRLIATVLTLIFVMASLPLHSVFAEFSGAKHSEISVAANAGDEVSVDCCEMPMSSAHHGNLHCSMDCPAIATLPLVLHAEYAAQFSISGYDHRLTQTGSTHFRPPIFN